MRKEQQAPAEAFIEAVFRLGWGFRVEIMLGGGTVGVGSLTSAHFGPICGTGAVAVILGIVVFIRPVRHYVGRVLFGAKVRRRWHRGVRSAGVNAFEQRLPMVIGVERLPAGERLDLRVPLGSCVADLESAAEVVAAALGVREVRVQRDPANASRADVVIVRRDPLAGGSLPWPAADADRLSLWTPIPVGAGENGRTVTVSLPERNVLLGGEPGAGKSVALSLLVATAALDPTVKLWLLDGKLVPPDDLHHADRPEFRLRALAAGTIRPATALSDRYCPAVHPRPTPGLRRDPRTRRRAVGRATLPRLL